MAKAKRKNKRRQNVTIFKIISIAILFWILIFSIVVIYLIFKDPIGFSIYLDKSEIPKGAEGILIYKINNYDLSTIKNVTVTTKIIDTFEKEEIVNFGEIVFLNNTFGSYTIKTNNLQRGQYTIKSELKYITSSEKEKIKPLTLSFKII